MKGVLERLVEQQRLNLLDLHFARLIERLDSGAPPALVVVAALTSHATAVGNVCLSLQTVAGCPLDEQEGVHLPELNKLIEILRMSRTVGRPGEFRPLVLDDAGRLYLQRYWQYEQQLADELLERAGDRKAFAGDDFRDQLRQLFPNLATGQQTDWQAVAAAVAVLRGLTVITGGPGSGKTTTVVRILALLQQQSHAGIRVVLTAPTGKAAARLQESITEAKRNLSIHSHLLDAIPEQAQTIHRLLGIRPGGAGIRQHADNLLECDALVVDEASMVDLALMVKLLQALPRSSAVILLGDRHQLASVEAGSVLGDICDGFEGYSREFASELSTLFNWPLPISRAKPMAGIADCIVTLRRSYRFDADSSIAQLAAAVNAGDGESVSKILRLGDRAEVGWMDHTSPLLTWSLQAYGEYLSLAAAGADPAAVFTAFNRTRLLTALNRGEHGAERLNAAIERAVLRSGVNTTREGWYAGRPVVVRANDYDLGLYNGDIGLMLKDAEGRLRLCFPTAESDFRWLSAGRLPRHDLAYAMTVHKSQGSEYERVLLVLPSVDSPLLTRELLYTAVTRARSSFLLSASETVLRAAIARRLQRASGLRERLWPLKER